jgi:hypothetical protein
VRELAQQFRADEVLIEDAGSGTFLLKELKGQVRGPPSFNLSPRAQNSG